MLGTEFFPLDATNFGRTISKIQAAKPDWIMTVLVGGGPISFYRQFHAAGLSGKIPIASTTFGAVTTSWSSRRRKVTALSSPTITSRGWIIPLTRIFSSASGRNSADYPPINDLTMAELSRRPAVGRRLRKAGTIDRENAIEVLETNISIDGPSGKVTIDQAHITASSMSIWPRQRTSSLCSSTEINVDAAA